MSPRINIAARFGVAFATAYVAVELFADVLDVTWNGGNMTATAPFATAPSAPPVTQDIDQIPGSFSFAQWNDQLAGTGRTIVLFSSLVPPGILSVGEISSGQEIDPSTFVGSGAGDGTQFDGTGSAYVGFRAVDGNVGWFRISFTQSGPITYSNGQFGSMGEATFAGGQPALIGDVNCDQAIDLLDIEPFVDLLIAGDYQLKADANLDGELNLLDVSVLVQLILNNNP